jgi:hypothetical protein
LRTAEKPYRDNLEQDGSQFILISCALLERFGVPEEDGARDFALWMIGIANGNFAEPFKCVDDQICAAYGYKRRTIIEKRAALLKWQEEANTTIVQVRETGKNDPTQYCVLFGRNVSRFIRNARGNRAFQHNPVRSIENAEETGLIDLIEEERDELNPDLSVRRKERKDAQPPKDDKVVKQSDTRKRLLRAAEKWADLEYELMGDVDEAWATLRAELERAVSGARRRFEMKADAGRLNKGGVRK